MVMSMEGLTPARKTPLPAKLPGDASEVRPN